MFIALKGNLVFGFWLFGIKSTHISGHNRDIPKLGLLHPKVATLHIVNSFDSGKPKNNGKKIF